MKSSGSSFSGGSAWKVNYGWPGVTYVVGDFDIDGHEDDIAIGNTSSTYPTKYSWWVMRAGLKYL
jgi:hypothetical protein